MARCLRDNRCMYMAHVVFKSVVVTVGVCGNVCCVSAVVKDSGFLALECWSMLYVSGFPQSWKIMESHGKKAVMESHGN